MKIPTGFPQFKKENVLIIAASSKESSGRPVRSLSKPPSFRTKRPFTRGEEDIRPTVSELLSKSPSGKSTRNLTLNSEKSSALCPK